MQDSLPRLLLDGRVPLSTLSLGPLIEASGEKAFPLSDSLASTGGPGASSASLSSLQGSSADVIQLPDMTAGWTVFFKVQRVGADYFSLHFIYCELFLNLYGNFFRFFKKIFCRTFLPVARRRFSAFYPAMSSQESHTLRSTAGLFSWALPSTIHR